MRTLLAALLLVATAVPVAAQSGKSYSADRFDTRIRILAGGALDVTETIVFRFVGGTFDHVFRDIPTRRNDGVEIVSASMDGRVLPFGKGPGQVEIRQRSPVRVRWRFAPRSDAVHTFVLNYVVRGAIRKDHGDVLDWVALPAQHDYRIAASEIVIESPVPAIASPVIETRRVDQVSSEIGTDRVQIAAQTIGKNGWVKTRIVFADSSIASTPPAWQQRQITAAALAPRWMIAAGIVFGIGLVLLFALRQGYDPPYRTSYGTSSAGSADEAPPDTLRPALAGALASNGSVTSVHALATLFTLADRGVISITEEPRSWGQRQFSVHRTARKDARTIAPEEAVLLASAFRHKNEEETTATLSKVRSRLEKTSGEFRKVVQQELKALGLWNDERANVRRRCLVASIALLVIAFALVLLAATGVRTLGAWPMLVPGTVAVIAIIGFVMYGALTPLSNEGVRRSEAWMAYEKHLKAIARDEARPGEARSRLLPLAIALGLASAWSKYMKNHPGDVPGWFQTMAHDEGAFPAFIAAGGAHAGAGGGGGVGGSGGGGASGAG